MPRGVNAYDESWLQGRNVARANSSNIVSPAMVTDGLVLLLDAANAVSYPKTGTTFYDLTTFRNNGSLVNGPTFGAADGGTIVLDGTNDYIQVANNVSLNRTTGTVCMWFKYSSITGAGSFIGKHDASGSFYGYHIFYDSSTSKLGAQIKNATGPETTDATQVSVSANTWYYVALAFASNSAHALYLNNTTVSTGACVAFTMSTQPLRIGDSVDTFWGIWAGNVGMVQAYNRFLSAAEIDCNFNATRARFGV